MVRPVLLTMSWVILLVARWLRGGKGLNWASPSPPHRTRAPLAAPAATTRLRVLSVQSAGAANPMSSESPTKALGNNVFQLSSATRPQGGAPRESQAALA